MDMAFKQEFLDRWNEFFPGAELPICFYYTDDAGLVDKASSTSEWRCFIADLAKVRKGQPMAFDADAVSCGGAQRYLGFTQQLRPDFEYFLSCGIEGKLEGERYKKTPQLVNEFMKHVPPFKAPARYIVFKRFDSLEEDDEPQVAIFFAGSDVLAGLFTLAGFDSAAVEAVTTPFGSGCSSIVCFPYRELQQPEPKPIIGMFDISARPYVASDILTFAAPWPKFVGMVRNMEESFLITASWDKIRKRLGKGNVPQEGSGPE